MLLLAILIVALSTLAVGLIVGLFGLSIDEAARGLLALTVCRWRGHRRARRHVNREGTIYHSRCQLCGRPMRKVGRDGHWRLGRGRRLT